MSQSASMLQRNKGIVRPLVECASSVRDIHAKADTDNIEQIQRRTIDN